MSRRKRLSSCQELADGAKNLRCFVDDEVEQRGGEPEGVHPIPGDLPVEFVDLRKAVRIEHAASSVQKRAPKLECGCVERDGRHVEKCSTRPELGVVDSEYEPENSAVRHQHALGQPG